jgi:hypothetical protein
MPRLVQSLLYGKSARTYFRASRQGTVSCSFLGLGSVYHLKLTSGGSATRKPINRIVDRRTAK